MTGPQAYNNSAEKKLELKRPSFPLHTQPTTYPNFYLGLEINDAVVLYFHQHNLLGILSQGGREEREGKEKGTKITKINTACSAYLCLVFLSAGATASIRVEIFDQSSRPPAFVIGGSLNWTGLFVIGMIFPFIVVSDTNWNISQLLPIPNNIGPCQGSGKRDKEKAIDYNILSTRNFLAHTLWRALILKVVYLIWRFNLKPAQRAYAKDQNINALSLNYWVQRSKNDTADVEKSENIVIFLSFFLCSRRTLAHSVSLSLWELFSSQGFISTCSFQKQRENLQWKSEKNSTS